MEKSLWKGKLHTKFGAASYWSYAVKKFEKAISSCNSIQDVRRAVGETPGLQEALQDSTEPTKALMHSIFSRLSLKDKPVLSYSTASYQEMDALFGVLHSIESALTRNHSKKDLHKLPRLKEFFAHCCYQRKYVFGVKKCGQLGCTICRPPQLQETICCAISQILLKMTINNTTSHSPVYMEH